MVDPHQLYCEQQFPKVEPLQVALPVPPQVPSVETLEVEEAVATADVLDAEVTGLTVLLAAFVEEETGALEDEEVPHVPKPVWQPVPQ